jgi:3-oxoacyl-(acyl-carrier-protein) synthase
VSGRRRRVVVTGVGTVNPLGNDRDTFWDAVTAGKSAIGPIRRFDPAGLQVGLAAEVRGFQPADHIPRRFIVKTDRFTHYALAATAEALAHARLDPECEDPFRIGISFGNNSGGWDICERGFQEYYGQGPTMVNPWQATAWFPTAPQGFVSIRYKLRGYSKSFACDRASGGCGLYFGFRSIHWGHNDVVLSGGSEAPITRLGVAAHVSTGELSRATDAAAAYLPFSPDRNGLVLGEGSTVLVLEDLAHAQRRGAPILGEILAVEQRTGDPDHSAALEDAIAAALRLAGRAPGQVDLVLAEGCGTVSGDRSEAAAIHRTLGGQVAVTVQKAAMGHLYGASCGTELAIGLLAMRCGLIPPTIGTHRPADDCPVQLVTVAEDHRVDTVLVSSRSREGTNVALVATRYQDG